MGHSRTLANTSNKTLDRIQPMIQSGCTCDVGFLRREELEEGGLRQALDVTRRDLHVIARVPLQRLQQREIIQAGNQLRHPLLLFILHTHTHARMHTRTHARTHVRMHTHTHTHTHARTHTHTHTHTHTRITHTRTHARTRTHAHAHAHTHARTHHTHTHTHVHAHTRTHTHPRTHTPTHAHRQTQTHTHTHTHARTHTHTHARTHTHTHTHTHTQTHTRTHIHTRTHHTHTYTHTRTYTHTHAHTHASHTHIHTHTHAQTASHTRTQARTYARTHHTDAHKSLFLWIVGTLHRLYIFYWPNYIFCPLTLNLPLTENLFAFLHFQINIIYYFKSFFPLWGTSGFTILVETFGHTHFFLFNFSKSHFVVQFCQLKKKNVYVVFMNFIH